MEKLSNPVRDRIRVVLGIPVMKMNQQVVHPKNSLAYILNVVVYINVYILIRLEMHMKGVAQNA